MKQFANYKGEMTDAPRDLSVKLFTYENGLIVWSFCPLNHTHQVRYALQVRKFNESALAASELGMCIHYAVECNGWLDEELKNLPSTAE